jgi:6-pyruvoyltetrahydropterin/6-carboxytetrahydropterin synthase
MSFEVGVVARFQARHHLVGDFGPANEPHGHDYRVEASAMAQALRPDGTLLDITVLQRALRTALDGLNGRDLNGIEALAQPNPTAEVVARYLHGRVTVALTGVRVRSLTVRVWESDDAFASYTDTWP